MLIFVLHSTCDDWPGWSLDSNPIHLWSQAKKNEMLIFGLCLTSDDQTGWLMNLNPICHPSPAKKNEMLIFGLHSTSDDWRGWSINSNHIHYPSPANKWNAHFWITFNFRWSARLVDGLKPHPAPLSSQKMKCSFLDYVQLLMIGQAGRRTATPSVTPLQPKKWNACFCIMFNFWWSAGLVDRLEPHLPSLSKQKNDMLIFVLHSSSDHWPGWSMDSNPICHLSPGIKWNAHFCITFNLWWSAGLVDELESHLPPLSSHKNEVLIFALHSTSDDRQGWSMDSNPICHPSPTKKIKCLFLDYVQLLMISQAGQWTQTPSATPLQPKKWYACFSIMLNFWWLARLVDGLEPHLLPLSSQKNEMLVFGLCSTSDDQPGWSMDLNPICNLSPTKKMICLFFDYVELLMIGQVGRWT